MPNAALAQSEGELDLVRAARAGDERAFESLYKRYRSPLLAYCRNRLRDPHLADDAVQEVFVRAWRYFSSFDTDRRVWPWLQTIAQHLCVDLIRASARNQRLEKTLKEAADGDSAIQAGCDELPFVNSEIKDALLDLNPRYRRILLLQALEDWSYRELAEADGTTVTSIAKVLTRAKERLRLKLGEVGGAFGILPVLRLRMARFGSSLRTRARVCVDSVRSYCGGAESQASALLFTNLAMTLVSLLAAATFSGGALGPSSPGHVNDSASIRLVSSTTQQEPPMAGRTSVKDQRDRPQRVVVGMAGVSFAMGESQQGNPDPTGGSFRVEIKTPDGYTVWRHENHHQCNRKNPELTPPGFPVSIRC